MIQMYRAQVTIRHFSANNYVNDKDPSAVWNGVSQRSSTKSVLKQIKKKILVKHNVHLQMGNNITCTIDPTTLAPTLSLPSSFDPGCNMTKYCYALTSSGSVSLVLIIIHSTLQPSRWSCTHMASWTQLPAREPWASTLTLSMVSWSVSFCCWWWW